MFTDKTSGIAPVLRWEKGVAPAPLFTDCSSLYDTDLELLADIECLSADAGRRCELESRLTKDPAGLFCVLKKLNGAYCRCLKTIRLSSRTK